MPKIKAIFTYPVKSCGGVDWFQAFADKRGLATDREFMVVDKNGRMMTQREYPRMCLIDIDTRPTVGYASLGFPGADRIFLPLFAQKHDYQEVVVSIWDDTVRAYDQGGLLAKWLSSRLGTECRLVRMADYEIRNTRHGEGQVGFADGYPVLGISQASLDDLNSRMSRPLPMDRFRPNIVFDGCEPFEEDTWRRIRIGRVEFVGETLCARCNIPTIDQATAKEGKEPSTTLAGFRRVKHLLGTPEWKTPYQNKVYFGRNFNIATFGPINTKMEVEVLERD